MLWISWAWDAHGLVGVGILVALVATYLALILGRHGRWLAVELRVWALAYPFYLLAVVPPDHQHVAVPAAGLPARGRGRLGGDADVDRGQGRERSGAGGWGVLALVLLVGLFWFTCTLLTYTPWAALPPLTARPTRQPVRRERFNRR